jgi:hypothetical protein
MREFEPDEFVPARPLTPEEQLERRSSELRNGLTDMQRLFLFGKLSGMNDKDAAIAAGYSPSVAENTKQRIWQPQVRMEFERLQHELASAVKEKPSVVAPRQTRARATEESDWR